MCVRVCVWYACVCAQSTPSDDAVDDKKPALYRMHTRVLNALKTSLWIRAATQPKESAKIIKTDHGRKKLLIHTANKRPIQARYNSKFLLFFFCENKLQRQLIGKSKAETNPKPQDPKRIASANECKSNPITLLPAHKHIN